MSCRPDKDYPPTKNLQTCLGGAGDMDKACRKAYGDHWEYSGSNWSSKGCFPGFTQPTCQQKSWSSSNRNPCCLGCARPNCGQAPKVLECNMTPLDPRWSKCRAEQNKALYRVNPNSTEDCAKDWCPTSKSCSDVFKSYCTTENYKNFPQTKCQRRCDGSLGHRDSWCDAAYQSFCTQQSTECPIDPHTGKRMPKCSLMSSTSDNGTICKNWMVRDKGASDVAVEQYCAKFNTPDCACENRSQDPQYQKARQDIINTLGFTNAPDACWYLPCGLPKNPGILMKWSEQVLPDCPDICLDVVKMYNEGKISGGINVKQTINCKFPDKPQPPPPEETPLIPLSPIDEEGQLLPLSPVDEETPLIPLTPPSEETDTKKQNMLWLYGIIGAIVFLLLVSILLFVMFK